MNSKASLVTVCGDLQYHGKDDYICTIELEKPLQVAPGMTVALQDVLLPPLMDTRKNEAIVSDLEHGLVRIALHSDLISSDTILREQLLRAFCVRIGQRHYECPYPIMLDTTTSIFHKLIFRLKIRTCEDWIYARFIGKMSLSLILDNK